MEVRRGYTTMVSDPDTGLALQMATIPLYSLADSELAQSVWNQRDDVLDALKDLIGSHGVAVDQLDVSLRSSSFEAHEEVVRGMLHQVVVPVLQTAPEVHGEELDRVDILLDELLEATVLAEHSSAAAIKAFGEIASATIKGASMVLVAVIATGAVTGVGGAAVLLLAPTGVIVLGTAASVWLKHVLMTRDRAR